MRSLMIFQLLIGVRSEPFTRFATTTDDFGNRHNKATEHPNGKSTLTTNPEGRD